MLKPFSAYSTKLFRSFTGEEWNARTNSYVYFHRTPLYQYSVTYSSVSVPLTSLAQCLFPWNPPIAGEQQNRMDTMLKTRRHEPRRASLKITHPPFYTMNCVSRPTCQPTTRAMIPARTTENTRAHFSLFTENSSAFHTSQNIPCLLEFDKSPARPSSIASPQRLQHENTKEKVHSRLYNKT